MLYKLLLLFCAYLPFQIALNPTEGIDLASIRVFSLALLFLWLAEGLRNKNLRIKLNATTFFVSLFLFLNLLSLVVAENPDWSLRKLMFVFSIWPIYFVFSNTPLDRKKWQRIFEILVGGGFVISLVAIGQFFMQFYWGLGATYRFWAENVVPLFLGSSFSEAVLRNPSWLVEISGKTFLRAIAFSPDPHMLSFYLGMLLPFTIGLYLRNKNKFYLLSAGLLLTADLLTFSRGGYLGLFGAAVIASLFLWKNMAQNYRWMTLGLMTLALLVLALPSPVAERFSSSFDMHEGSNQGRIATWRKALDIASDKPFLGVGIGNYPLAVKATAGQREPIYAHSVYLDIAAETGILSLLAWLGLLFGLFRWLFRKAGSSDFYFAAAMSAIIFMGHALVETPIYSAVVLPLFLIILAYGAQDDTQEQL